MGQRAKPVRMVATITMATFSVVICPKNFGRAAGTAVSLTGEVSGVNGRTPPAASGVQQSRTIAELGRRDEPNRRACRVQ